MSTTDIPWVRELPPRADTLCLLLALTIFAGRSERSDTTAAEGYLRELEQILGGNHASVVTMTTL